MDGKNNGSFWPSYVDIMSTLFAITLILFAVSYSRFKIKEKQLKKLVDQYENIIMVYSTVGSIDSTKYFRYNEENLKHLFTVDVEYQTGEYRIDKLKYDQTDKKRADKKRDSIISAGNIIKTTIQKIEKLEKEDTVKNNIKFLVVIEGQSSRIKYEIDDWKNNYTLSYLRARFLNEFWKKNGIHLDSIPKCELIISGSGEKGVPREEPSIKVPQTSVEKKKWEEEEMKNQRFLIHIVPVIGNIEVKLEDLKNLK